MTGGKEKLKEKMKATEEAEKAKHGSNGHGEIKIPDLLSWPEVSVGRYLRSEPPKQDYIFDEILIKGSVGGIFAPGGTSKSYTCLLARNLKLIRTCKHYWNSIIQARFK